ncbi:MAG TPA: hypothetical protein ENK05_00440 [Gammaproteobacteria bacterium]|nr:hypothetical protein [Gammaproteobacteria bacterium]
MNLGALSLEDAPGFRVPLQFFLTVPAFGILAATLILFDGGLLLQSRWLPATLAVTHAFTLGYIAMAMLGALFQMLPVVMGTSFPRTEPAARLVHGLLTAGTLCLVAAFEWRQAMLFLIAAMLLVPVLLLFAAGTLIALRQGAKGGGPARAVRLAVMALAVTAGLGGWLAAGHALPAVPLQRALTDYHAGWGLAGWILVLVVGISTQVIPMFLTTPPYPKTLERWLPPLLVVLLLTGSVAPLDALRQGALLALTVLAAVYALVSLHLLQRRRRKRFDVTVWFWRLGMACLLAAAGLEGYAYVRGGSAGPELAVLAGLLFLAGFAVSVINGMLYKIVPFLVWLHLRMPVLKGLVPPGTRLYTPNIHEVIAPQRMKWQFLLHAAALVLLLAAVAATNGRWAQAGAVLLLASNGLLLFNLGAAVRLYARHAGSV